MDMKGFSFAISMKVEHPDNEYYKIGGEIICKNEKGKVRFDGIVIANDLDGIVTIGTNKINDLA